MDFQNPLKSRNANHQQRKQLIMSMHNLAKFGQIFYKEIESSDNGAIKRSAGLWPRPVTDDATTPLLCSALHVLIIKPLPLDSCVHYPVMEP